VKGKISSKNRIAHFREEKPSGKDGGTSKSGSYQKRSLTHHYGDTTFAKLSGSQITFTETGTYRFKARCPAFHSQRHKCKIRNITNSTDIIVGACQHNHGNLTADTTLETVQDIGSLITIQLQHRVAVARATYGWGVASGFGDMEVYAELWIEKLS
jgi:hypothetical protein